MNGLEIITRAYRKIGVGQDGEALEGALAVDALDTLNSMLHELRGNDVMIPEYTITLADDTSLDDADIRAIVLMLADELNDEIGAIILPSMARRIESAKLALKNRYFAPAKVDFSDLPSSRNRYTDFVNQ